jgi:hypothetical protein
VLLPQELAGDAKIGAFLLSVSCSTSQQAEFAKRIIERTDAQAAFSSAVAFLSAANIATALSRQN